MQRLMQQEGPRTEPHGNNPTSQPISNRYNKLLEFRVTHTKQGTALRSNRYKFAIFDDDFRAWTVSNALICEVLR